MESNEINDEKNKSAYHGGFQYLERIHEILQKLNQIIVPSGEMQPGIVYIRGISIQQHQARLCLLQALYREIIPKMTKEEIIEHEEAEKESLDEFDKISVSCQHTQGKGKITFKFLENFDTWEKHLRMIVEKKGLLMPEKKGAEEAIST